jgi:hypothetical protein
VHRLGTLASLPGGERHAPSSVLRASWCNGVAGRILLWVKAFERTGNRFWIASASSPCGTSDHIAISLSRHCAVDLRGCRAVDSESSLRSTARAGTATELLPHLELSGDVPGALIANQCRSALTIVSTYRSSLS